METGKEFTRLLNNLLRENQQYDTELKNFLDYLKQRDLLNKCFDLSLYDIDQFFDSLVGIKMGVSSTLNAYIAALSCLFLYSILNHLFSCIALKISRHTAFI